MNNVDKTCHWDYAHYTPNPDTILQTLETQNFSMGNVQKYHNKLKFKKVIIFTLYE